METKWLDKYYYKIFNNNEKMRHTFIVYTLYIKWDIHLICMVDRVNDSIERRTIIGKNRIVIETFITIPKIQIIYNEVEECNYFLLTT